MGDKSALYMDLLNQSLLPKDAVQVIKKFIDTITDIKYPTTPIHIHLVDTKTKPGTIMSMDLLKHVQNRELIIQVELRGLSESELSRLSISILTAFINKLEVVKFKSDNIRLISKYKLTEGEVPELSNVVNIQSFIDLIVQFYISAVMNNVKSEQKYDIRVA